MATPEFSYAIDLQISPSSKWTITTDVLGFSVDRSLNIYPGGVEAGTADVTLDNGDGRYSPLVTSYHGGLLRPTTGVDIVGLWANPKSGGAVTSYYLFRGLIDGIQVNPGMTERTVNLSCLDRWALLQQREVSTSMMIGFSVASLLTAIFDAASIDATQRTFDVIGDVIPYASFQNRVLSTVLQELIEGGGYAAYVTHDGLIRVRDRYFDVGGVVVGSYDRSFSLTFSYADDDLVNQIMLKGEPRQPFGSTTVCANIQEPMAIAGNSFVEFFLDYQDPRNQEAASARSMVSPVASLDWLVTVGTVTTSSPYMTSASLTAYFFGDSAKIKVRNNTSTAVYLSRMQVRGEPIVRLPTLSVQYDSGSSQAIYGVRNETIETNLFTTQELLSWRALDILELFSDPNPKVSMQLVDDLPTAFAMDVGNVVTIVNTVCGIDDQFTILRLSHNVATDGAGWVHGTTLQLQRARDFGGFVLDTTRVNSGRLSR